METIKTENKVESKSPEQKRIEQIKMDLEPINIALQKASLEVSLLFEHLNMNREEDYLYDLMFDVIERMQSAVDTSVKFELSYHK